MKLLDWNPESDSYLKEKEVRIHAEYHHHLSSTISNEKEIFASPKRKLRIKALNKSVKLTGSNMLTGKVLEIGAGDGWCSAYILKKHKVSQLYTMEINKPALHELIPKVFSLSKVKTDNAILVYGSFNNIQLKNELDYVIAMGAIHHSANLYLTFKEIFNALKPGGWLIAQEPAMKDTTKNFYYHQLNSEEKNFKGILKVKNSERTDIFYRRCEYYTAAYHSGFDIYSFPMHEISVSRIKRKIKSKINSQGLATNMVFYAQKPLNNWQAIPPTKWETNK